MVTKAQGKSIKLNAASRLTRQQAPAKIIFLTLKLLGMSVKEYEFLTQ